MIPDFVKHFKPLYYNDPYYFGHVHVVEAFASVRDAIANSYVITDIPVLDDFGGKVGGLFLAQRGREFAFVVRLL